MNGLQTLKDWSTNTYGDHEMKIQKVSLHPSLPSTCTIADLEIRLITAMECKLIIGTSF